MSRTSTSHEAATTAATVVSLVDDEVLQQYRIMAQVEANIRIRDNTGFDKEEYQRQQRERERERDDDDAEQQQNQHQRTRPRYRHIRYFFPAAASTRPRPMLPEPRTAAVRLSSTSLTSQHSASASAPINAINGELFSSSSSLSHHHHHHPSTSNNNNNNHHGLFTSSTVRAEEPPLPPRRANRRFVEHPRTPTVPELCEGIVVRWPDGRRRVITQQEEDKVQEESDLYILQHTNPTSILSTDPSTSDSFYTSNVLLDPKHTVVVECLGCRCWLRVHRLASLVKCVHCKSVTPSIPILEVEEQQHQERSRSSRK
jgi:hypothetical protein